MFVKSFEVILLVIFVVTCVYFLVYFIFDFLLSVSLARARVCTDHFFFLSPDFDEIDNTCGY